MYFSMSHACRLADDPQVVLLDCAHAKLPGHTHIPVLPYSSGLTHKLTCFLALKEMDIAK